MYTMLSPSSHLKKTLESVFKLPILLFIIIVLSIFFSDYVSIFLKQFFYSISLSIKDFLIFFVPIILLAYISSSLIELGQKISWFIGLFLFCVVISNTLATFIPYIISCLLLKSTNYFHVEKFQLKDSLQPLWSLHFPHIISNEYALLIGVVWGLLGANFKIPFMINYSRILTKFISFFLSRIFVPLVPLFMMGFILKLGHDGLIMNISKEYMPLFFVIFLTQVFYVFGLYLVSSKFRISNLLFYLKNIIPSAITAFCTMSSIATIPITLAAAEKNTKDVALSRMLIPGTANIHLIGDSIGAPIMCMMILLSFGFKFPSFTHYVEFAFQFVLARFCIAAVPGGGIIVMVPIIAKSH